MTSVEKPSRLHMSISCLAVRTCQGCKERTSRHRAACALARLLRSTPSPASPRGDSQGAGRGAHAEHPELIARREADHPVRALQQLRHLVRVRVRVGVRVGVGVRVRVSVGVRVGVGVRVRCRRCATGLEYLATSFSSIVVRITAPAPSSISTPSTPRTCPRCKQRTLCAIARSRRLRATPSPRDILPSLGASNRACAHPLQALP